MLANASLSKDLKLVANKGRIGVIDHLCILGIRLPGVSNTQWLAMDNNSRYILLLKRD